jgi:transcriptional regulator with XRE-family HTH domain
MPQDNDPTASSGAATFLGVSEAPSGPPKTGITNRLRAILVHVPWYTITGGARLAEDARISRSTVSRLLSGKMNPSYRLDCAITRAVSGRSGIQLEVNDIFSCDGTYVTASVCELMDCPGCLPPWAWDERTDSLKPEWEDAAPGE